MGTLRFFEEVVSFKIRRTFGFADYISHPKAYKVTDKQLKLYVRSSQLCVTIG